MLDVAGQVAPPASTAAGAQAVSGPLPNAGLISMPFGIASWMRLIVGFVARQLTPTVRPTGSGSRWWTA